MKLLHYTTRNFLLSTMLILSLTGILLYFMLRALVEQEMVEQLDLQAQMIAEELHKGNTVHYPFVEAIKVPYAVATDSTVGDTLIFDYLRGHQEDYKYLRVDKTIGADTYRIKVMVTFIGWDKYYLTIFLFLAGAAMLFGLAGVFLNALLSRKLWTPFFFNLKQLNAYSVSRSETVFFKPSKITEFTEMQQSLEALTERSMREYLSLREFTENASHEIQTPLGIIQSKLDRLSQMKVDEDMAALIVQAKTSVERLKRVNKSLLFLAKLDNNAYTEKEKLFADQLIMQQYEQMEDLYAGKGIRVTLQLQPWQIASNRHLADVLISNLFANALHYTPEQGAFNIYVTEGVIVFENTGPPLTFPAEQLFDRFKKGEQYSQSTGLGLSIVKQIVILNGWHIHYTYQSGKHLFTIHLS